MVNLSPDKLEVYVRTKLGQKYPNPDYQRGRYGDDRDFSCSRCHKLNDWCIMCKKRSSDFKAHRRFDLDAKDDYIENKKIIDLFDNNFGSYYVIFSSHKGLCRYHVLRRGISREDYTQLWGIYHQPHTPYTVDIVDTDGYGTVEILMKIITHCADLPKFGYIYMIKEREFIKSNEHVYKVGKTSKSNFSRFANYPKQSKIIYYQKTYEHDEVERAVLKHLAELFKVRHDIGREYFEGNPVDILLTIIKIMQNPRFGRKLTIESKLELKNYHDNERRDIPDAPALIKRLLKVADGKCTEDDYEQFRGGYITNHKLLYAALDDTIYMSVFETYLIMSFFVEMGIIDTVDKTKRLEILGMYNGLKWIIVMLQHDPQRGDYCDDDNNQYIKLAGEFLNKLGGRGRMLKFASSIPMVFRRDIDHHWDGIGDWSA